MAKKTAKTTYFCKNCGAESPKWIGKCPACGEWNTYIEEPVAPKSSRGTLFGNDEREGWEAVRLALPVTRRTVVRSRYLALVILFGIVAVVVNLVGIIMGAGTALALYGQIGFMPLDEGALLTGLFLAVYLIYLGLTTPVVFKMGLSKARIYFSMPFMLCLLFTFDPVKDALAGIASSLNLSPQLLENPLPLLLPALAVAVAVFAASMLVSERIYSARDF